MQHSNDHNGQDYMLPLFEKIHNYKMDSGTCIGRVSGLQSGKSDLGRQAITRGMDFNRNTSSAEARLLSSEGAAGTFSSGSSDGFSVVVGFQAGVSVEMDEMVVPSKITSSEEVSVPARAILILPRPSLHS